MKRDVRTVEPWRVVDLDGDCGGRWVVTGDLTGDGRAEIVSARNHEHRDRHWVVAAAAQDLEGRVLWTWGEPGAGRRGLHHDVAVQIYDWDGDGCNEVLLASEKELVVLEGATGRERRRLPLPEGYSSDCIVIANLSGGDHPRDIIVKDRYWNLWAYDCSWRRLWHAREPGGYRTAHQPLPLDIDGDGRDEVVAGYGMLDPDGGLRWVLDDDQSGVDLGAGHLDCLRVLENGGREPADWRFVVTYCGAGGIAVIDGCGRILREVTGHHFESIDTGRIDPVGEGLQILTAIDHLPRGEQPLFIFDKELEVVARRAVGYNRHHTLVDWEGEGTVQPVSAWTGMIYDHRFEPVCTLELPGPGSSLVCNTPPLDGGGRPRGGDMDGDGRPDITIVTEEPLRAYIFRNERGRRIADPPGAGVNFSLY